MSILKARNRQPIINFGLGVTELTINVLEVVNLYLQTTYDLNFYGIQVIVAPSITIGDVSDFAFTLQPTIIGEYDVRVDVTIISSGTIIQSNRLKLIVI